MHEFDVKCRHRFSRPHLNGNHKTVVCVCVCKSARAAGTRRVYNLTVTICAYPTNREWTRERIEQMNDANAFCRFVVLSGTHICMPLVRFHVVTHSTIQSNGFSSDFFLSVFIFFFIFRSFVRSFFFRECWICAFAFVCLLLVFCWVLHYCCVVWTVGHSVRDAEMQCACFGSVLRHSRTIEFWFTRCDASQPKYVRQITI